MPLFRHNNSYIYHNNSNLKVHHTSLSQLASKGIQYENNKSNEQDIVEITISDLRWKKKHKFPSIQAS